MRCLFEIFQLYPPLIHFLRVKITVKSKNITRVLVKKWLIGFGLQRGSLDSEQLSH
jgi:hypothetical protein